MGCNKGEIYELTDVERAAYKADLNARIERDGRRLVPLSDRQHADLKPMGSTQRKGYMRNQPCVCGSGKKFKKCCWSKYA